jgi:hypothetical protein
VTRQVNKRIILIDCVTTDLAYVRTCSQTVDSRKRTGSRRSLWEVWHCLCATSASINNNLLSAIEAQGEPSISLSFRRCRARILFAWRREESTNSRPISRHRHGTTRSILNGTPPSPTKTTRIECRTSPRACLQEEWIVQDDRLRFRKGRWLLRWT